jgi:predicted CXXCH cytochrome family protein
MTPATLYRAGLLAAVLLLAAFPAHVSGEDGQGGVTFVSPVHGSLVVDEKVTLAGRLPAGAARASLFLNGHPVEGVRRQGSSFSASLAPVRGFNEIEVRMKGRSARLTFVYKLKAAGRVPYRFHQPLIDEVCEPCHDEKGGRDAALDGALCRKCHGTRAVMYPYVHGPVAAGKCLVCHDPHGSTLPALTRSETKAMCTFCHDQLSTAQHTSGRTRVCTICHSPHYSMKRFLLKGSF